MQRCWAVPSCRCSRAVGRVAEPSSPARLPLPLPTAWRFGVITCQWLLPFSTYNFQRWMSRFEQRWRAQRSAISIVNCRIPWTDRDLNAYCAFGISLKACLLQCLCFVVPAALPHQALLLRVLVPQDAHLGAPEAFSWQGYAATASLLSISCFLFAARVVAVRLALIGLTPRRQAPTTWS